MCNAATQKKLHTPSIRFRPADVEGSGFLDRKSDKKRHAPIEHDRLSGHVVVAENHDDGVRDFVGEPHPSERNVARQIGAAAHHVGFDQGRRHRIDGDAFLDQPRRIAAGSRNRLKLARNAG